MEANPVQDVLVALSDLGTAHRLHRASLDRYDEELDQLQRQWMEQWAQLVHELDEEGVADWQALEHDLQDFLLTGEEQSLEALPDDAREAIRSRRPRFLGRLREIEAELDEVGAGVVEPYRVMSARLEGWLSQVRAGERRANEDWSRILAAWRKELGLTTREAGELLDVSSATIVRHERQDRTPSLPQLAALVAQMTSVGPVLPDDKRRRAVRHVARLFDDGVPGAGREVLRRAEDDRTELLVQLEDLANEMHTGRLRMLVALAQHEPALEALEDWTRAEPEHPLRPILAALASARTPPHSGERSTR